MRGCRAVVTDPRRPTPFAFPLIVELFREKLTTEALEARVARMVAELEAAAQDLAGATQ
jgi:ATP-dependent Lhr-like helicase